MIMKFLIHLELLSNISNLFTPQFQFQVLDKSQKMSVIHRELKPTHICQEYCKIETSINKIS